MIRSALLGRLVVSGTMGVFLAVMASPAQAALMSVSTTAPTIDGADIAQLVGGQTANNDYTAIWSDRPRQGQSFTTTSGAWIYQLQAITLKHNYSPIPPPPGPPLALGPSGSACWMPAIT